ncbi:MAG: response regulator [Rectinema subterraneum]
MIEVLLVEDDPFTREMMMTTLRSMGYHAAMASNGQQAIEFLQNEKAEVILMDVDMPVMNGIEATRQIKKEGIDSIVIMLTAFGDEKAMEEAAEAGADDYLTKPVEMRALKARIELAKKARTFHVARSKLLIENKMLIGVKEEEINACIEENYSLSAELLYRLSLAAEFRDDDTYEHTRRVGRNAAMIAQYIGKDAEYIYLLTQAAPLHDIGKIGISDTILLKPGSLDNDEFETMKTHTIIGKKILNGSQTKILQLAESIAYSHHERWDGSGYPQGLQGESIPLEGRIVCIADSMDAMFSKRPYKGKMPPKKVKEELQKNRGLQFDPTMVDAVLEHWEEIADMYHAEAGG